MLGANSYGYGYCRGVLTRQLLSEETAVKQYMDVTALDARKCDEDPSPSAPTPCVTISAKSVGSTSQRYMQQNLFLPAEPKAAAPFAPPNNACYGGHTNSGALTVAVVLPGSPRQELLK